MTGKRKPKKEKKERKATMREDIAFEKEGAETKRRMSLATEESAEAERHRITYELQTK